MKLGLSWKFEDEENFSDYIEEYHLDTIGGIIGKTLLRDTSIREKKADFGDHDGTLKVDIRVETDNGEYVIIENQYNKTNHDHFGKLFTYATMLSSEDKTVTDAVWIVECVREEHYKAVMMINDLLKEREINFKIWLLVVELTEYGINKEERKEQSKRSIELRFPLKNDFFVRGSKEYDVKQHDAELKEFMPRLKAALSDELKEWNKPNIAPSTLHCITVTSNKTTQYDYNIPFRVGKKHIAVEARFKDEFYKTWINDNWERLIDDIIHLDNEFLNYCDLYSISYEITKSYVKILGFVKADITNENKWSYYIDETLDLVRIIENICLNVERF